MATGVVAGCVGSGRHASKGSARHIGAKGLFMGILGCSQFSPHMMLF